MTDIFHYAKGECLVALPDGKTEKIWAASPDIEPEQLRRLLDRESGRLVDCWRAWLKWADDSEWKGAHRAVRAWLVIRCYVLIASLIEVDDYDETDEESVFEARIRLYSRGARGRRVRNKFQIGLLALFAQEQRKKNDPNPEPLTNKQRELLGKQLWHAFRHVVPPPFLIAFLTEYGPARRRGEFTKNSYVEPGFSNWIVDRLCENYDSSELRDGEYSSIILNEVANRMGITEDFTANDRQRFSDDEDDGDENEDDGSDWDGPSRAS